MFIEIHKPQDNLWFMNFFCIKNMTVGKICVRGEQCGKLEQH